MEKKKARCAGRERLCLLTQQDRAAKSAEVLRNLEILPELHSARVVLAYAPLPDEVDLRPLLRRMLAGGVMVAFPVLVSEPGDGRMDAVPVNDIDRDLKVGRFHIRQPRDGMPLDPRKIDFILVPAVAYDLTGNRLGRGGGYYDRFLAGRAPKAFRCGVAFECQVVATLPADEHDCRMNAIVTETGVRRNGRLNCLSDVV